MPEIDLHRAVLKAILSETAESISLGNPNLAWNIADFPSVHYDLSLLLGFVDRRRPEDELVVVTVHLSMAANPSWIIDAIEGDGTLIGEDRIGESDGALMLADPDAAALRLTSFLAGSRPVIARVISERSGDIAAR